MFQSINVSFINMGRVLVISAALLVAACSGSPDDRAQSYYQRGVKLLSQQDYVKASLEFKNALQLKKDLVGAWRGLAEIEERNRNWPALLSIRRTIVELDRNDVEAKLKLASLLSRANALDEALSLVNAAGELSTGDPKVLGTKAAILFRLNDFSGAAREARSALEIDPANGIAILVLASERLATGDPEGALLLLDRAPAGAESADIGIPLFKIKLFEQLGKHDQVEPVLLKLIEQHPEESLFQKALIKYYLDQKRVENAEKELRALSARNPADFTAGLDVIRFLDATKGPAAARDELVTRTRAGATAFEYQIALAEFDLAQGNIADGMQLLEKLASKSDSPKHTLAAEAKLAEVHLRKKDFDAVRALADGILRKDQRNLDGLKLRALVRLEQGQLDAAITDVRQALNEQPGSTEFMLLLASAYERSGSIELAEKQYADVTRVSNFEPSVVLNYVTFLRRRGDNPRAENVLTELASRWPKNETVLSALAQVRLALQNWTGAQEVAGTIRNLGNDRGTADQILGAALSGLSRYQESIGVLQQAYAANPGAAQPMIGLFNALVGAGKVGEAVTFLQTVLASDPDNAEAYVLLGSIQLGNNASQEALKSFQAAIERQPKKTAAYQALANLHLREKNTEEALRVVHAGLDQQPNSFGLRLTLAGILEIKKDYESAIREYEHMLKQDPGSLIVANNLASLLSDRRTDKASLDRALSLAGVLRKSQIPAFKDTLGWIYYQRGDYNSAIPLLEEAVAELPQRGIVHYHLGMSYVSAGQLGKASEQLKKAVMLVPQDDDLQAKISAAQERAASN